MKAADDVSLKIKVSTEGEDSVAKLSKGIDSVADSAEGVAPRVNSLSAAFGRLSNVASRYAQVAGRMVAVSPVAWLTAGTVGAVMMARSVAASAREISNLSSVANASTTEFQRYAYAAGTVGVAHDKMADILKDVGDKVGDFLQTGGGPMKDFFERIAPLVGVTADQFRNLSGPQALQLYFNSLEKANLSQSEMTFYLEAIANDATLLLPLLRNNGAAFRALGDEADRFGKVIGEEVIAKGREFSENLERLEALVGGVKIAIGSELIPTLNQLTAEFLNARLAGLGFVEALIGIGLSDPGKSPAEQIARITAEIDRLKNGSFSEKSLFENLAPEQSLSLLEKQLKYFQLELARDASSSQVALGKLKDELAGVGQEIQRYEGLQAARGGYLNAFDKSSLERLREQANGIRERIGVLEGLLNMAPPASAGNADQQAKQLQLERQIAQERERLMDQLAVKHGLASNTILKQGAERHKVEMARAKELASQHEATYKAAIQGAKDAAAEVKKLRAEGDQAVKDASQAANARRANIPEATGGLQGSSPGQSDERAAREMIDSARGDAAIANMAALNGNLDRAAQFAERASSSAKAAWDLVGKIKDDGTAAKLFEEIGDIQKSAKNAEAKAAEGKQTGFEQQASEALQNLQGQLAEIDRLKNIEIDANIEQATSKISTLTEQLKALPESKTIQLNVVTNGVPGVEAQPAGDLPARAYGGPLPGTDRGDRSDHVAYWGTPGEWVIQRPAVRLWGDANMRLINEGKMPRFAYGGEIGATSLAQRVSIPSVDAAAPASLPPLTGRPLVLPDGSQVPVYTDARMEDAIVKLFSRAASQRGRRR